MQRCTFVDWKMVYYFTSQDGITIFMGKDKFENEGLIAHGWPEDVWFHVDNHSSAHVYLRLPKGMTIDTIHPATLEECFQLVKANSIEGCKLSEVPVVYTPWENLKKRDDMDVGQIGYKNMKEVRHGRVSRDREIVKRLMRTKSEREPDLRAERIARDEAELAAMKAERRVKQAAEKAAEAEKRKERELRSYSTLFEKLKDPEHEDDLARVVPTKDVSAARAYEDDFM